MELWGASPHFCIDDYTPEERVARIRDIRQMLKDRDLRLTAFQPEQCRQYPINIASPIAYVRERSMQFMERYLEDTLDLGTDRMILAPGWGYVDAPEEEAFARSVEAIRRLAEKAAALGVKLSVDVYKRQAYFSESVRGAIGGIDKGQMEGGQAIGMSYLQIMLHVIIPQAFRNLIPQIGNTYVSAIKDTSVLNVIAVTELYFTARTVTGTYYKFFETYCIVSVIYFVCTFVISRLLKLLEKFMAGSSNYELITESEEEVSK